MADVLADLRAKLKARKGRAGFADNVAELERVIADAEGAGFIHREAASGRYVTAEFAEANPATTYRVRVR